tara:strand:- start:3188 stop:3721 length:534 start_codon:yes stop_codon:yes gene_type:complete
MSRKFLATSFLGIMLVSGCTYSGTSSNPNFSGGSPQLVASPDKVSAMLAESAQRASVALETLAAVERSRTPNVPMAPIDNAPAELRRAVTVNWVGPIEPIAKTLADRAGYGFTVLGSKPAVEAVVSLDVENVPVIDAFRDIGLQLGMRGDVKVDARNKMVEIYYAPHSGLGGPEEDI